MTQTYSQYYQRLIYTKGNFNGFYGVNTNSDTAIFYTITNHTVEPNFASFATSSAQFYQTTLDGTVVVKDVDFNDVITITLPSASMSSLTSTIYDASLDKIFVLWKNSTVGRNCSIISPQSNSIDSNVLVGSDNINGWIFNGRPGQCFTLNQNNNNIEFFSLPDFTPQGLFTGSCYGNCYCPLTDKIYMSFSNNIEGTAEVWEIDPSTLNVDYIYTFPGHFSGGQYNFISDIVYNPTSQVLFLLDGYGGDVGSFIYKIDPVSREIVCKVETRDYSTNNRINSILGVDYSNGNLYAYTDSGIEKYSFL